mgnify:FL=1
MIALGRARMAMYSSNDVPVGAIVMDANRNLVSVGHNQRELMNEPTLHAELVALKLACKTLNSWRLDGCTLVTTLEPCLMCAGAILESRISRLVIGAWDKKAGACGSIWDVLRDGRSMHKVEVVSGILEKECSHILSNFFSKRR